MDTAAAVLLCLVLGVSDGDTLRVHCGTGEQRIVRLTEIDAPEKRRAFGARAKQALSDRPYNRTASPRVAGEDRYGRLLSHIDVDGLNINFALVQRGMAWCYECYQSQADLCHRLQTDAETAKRGLWAHPTPAAPWDFRATRRKPAEPGARKTCKTVRYRKIPLVRRQIRAPRLMPDKRQAQIH